MSGGKAGGDWFDEWVLYHATIFGRATDKEALSMLDSWRNFLVPANYTQADLIAATNYVAANHPPKFVNEHLAAIIAALSAAKQARKQEEEERPSLSNDCPECKGAGWLVVPSTRYINLDEQRWEPAMNSQGQPYWVDTTLACGCRAGERWQRSHGGIDLIRYESHFPRWKSELRRVRALQAELAAKGPKASGKFAVDLEKLAKRLAGELPGDRPPDRLDDEDPPF